VSVNYIHQFINYQPTGVSARGSENKLTKITPKLDVGGQNMIYLI